MAHIDELQALVIVEHESGQNNLYLSDEEGVYFSLSVPDLVLENNVPDLEVVRNVCTHDHVLFLYTILLH